MPLDSYPRLRVIVQLPAQNGDVGRLEGTLQEGCNERRVAQINRALHAAFVMLVIVNFLVSSFLNHGALVLRVLRESGRSAELRKGCWREGPLSRATCRALWCSSI